RRRHGVQSDPLGRTEAARASRTLIIVEVFHRFNRDQADGGSHEARATTFDNTERCTGHSSLDWLLPTGTKVDVGEVPGWGCENRLRHAGSRNAGRADPRLAVFCWYQLAAPGDDGATGQGLSGHRSGRARARAVG